MKRTTGSHPTWNTKRVGHGAGRWIEEANRVRERVERTLREEDAQIRLLPVGIGTEPAPSYRDRREPSGVVWTNAHTFGPRIGEDGWVSPGAMRFSALARNYAWILFARGEQTLPCPDERHQFFLSILALAHPRFPDEPRPLVRMSSMSAKVQLDGMRMLRFEQLWVCRLLDGRDVMVTPQEAVQVLIPHLKGERA